MDTLDTFEKYKHNPFGGEVLKYIQKKNAKVGWSKTKISVLDESTGEIESAYNAIYTKKQVDTQQYNKLYLKGLKALFGLNKTAQKVLEYIFANIKIKQDYIIFSMQDCKEYCNYSSNQIVYNGLASLIKAEMIARTNEHYKYWINPTMMFNGDRLVLINEYEKTDYENNILEESGKPYRIEEKVQDSV